ncbi:SLC2A4 regulator isoform X2 [Rhinolophus sinicus]|uniref:SLC2A4 regulator isoform X2 n=1 Tax=Rhinolophus sinicus TaxID=89399 RepID=UPI003D79ED10
MGPRRGRGRAEGAGQVTALGQRGAAGCRSRAGVGGPASPARPGAASRVSALAAAASAPDPRAMQAERPPAPGPGCGRPPPRAAGRDPAAALVSVPAPPQGSAVSGGFAGLEFATPQEPEPRDPGTWAGAAARAQTPSTHSQVPAHRAPLGKAWLDEVMAAAALTSLSTSPLLLGAPAAAFSTEPGLQPWQESLVRPRGSYGSSPSGDWGWDLASEQSSPATPSPPLPPEAAHFLFGEPAPRKRKSSVQVLFQCLWKRCGKVLSSASTMQRHIRLVHLGRQAEPEQSDGDGEEDFYYTELDIGLDALTSRLSSLTPMSTAASMLPACPHVELPEPRALPGLLHPLALSPPPGLSSVATAQVCHSDHAYQGCLAPTQLEPQPTTGGACVPALPSKLGASLRKPRGDAKKCRKVYGTERRDLWCAACRWKKACRRFLD